MYNVTVFCYTVKKRPLGKEEEQSTRIVVYGSHPSPYKVAE